MYVGILIENYTFPAVGGGAHEKKLGNTIFITIILLLVHIYESRIITCQIDRSHVRGTSTGSIIV